MPAPIEATAAEVSARLDRLPSSRTVWTIVLLISLGCVFEFYDLFFTAYVAPGMIASGLFTEKSLGVFASLEIIRVAGFGTFVFSTFAGLWFGVVVLGRAADRFGRQGFAAITASEVGFGRGEYVVVKFLIHDQVLSGASSE